MKVKWKPIHTAPKDRDFLANMMRIFLLKKMLLPINKQQHTIFQGKYLHILIQEVYVKLLLILPGPIYLMNLQNLNKKRNKMKQLVILPNGWSCAYKEAPRGLAGFNSSEFFYS